MGLDSVLTHPWMKSYCPKNSADEPQTELDNKAMSILIGAGFDKKQILRSLMDEDASELTAAYHLIALKNTAK